jgi:hypothetical protein
MQYTPQMLNQWETVIIADTQDGSGMKVWLEAYNHDSNTPQYRVRYGEENENSLIVETNWFECAVKEFNECVMGEILGYFGLDNL